MDVRGIEGVTATDNKKELVIELGLRQSGLRIKGKPEQVQQWQREVHEAVAVLDEKYRLQSLRDGRWTRMILSLWALRDIPLASIRKRIVCHVLEMEHLELIRAESYSLDSLTPGVRALISTRMLPMLNVDTLPTLFGACSSVRSTAENAQPLVFNSNADEVAQRWVQSGQLHLGFLDEVDAGRKLLARGANSMVYRLTMANGKSRAVRVIKEPRRGDARFLRSIYYLRVLAPSNFVCTSFACIAPVEEGARLLHVLEFVHGCTLFQAGKHYMWDPAETAWAAKALLEALEYVHSRGIVHREIDSTHIMMERETPSSKPLRVGIKLLDFGSATFVRPGTTGQVGGVTMAPEMIQGRTYDEKVDLYSAGITLAELLNRSKHPQLKPGALIEEQMLVEILFLVALGKPMDPIIHHAQANAECKDFFAKILAVNPEDRPSATELLQHPYVTTQAVPDKVARKIVVVIGRTIEMRKKSLQ